MIRFTGEKMQIKWQNLAHELPALLDKIQVQMFAKAVEKFKEKAKVASNWQDFMTQLNSRNVVLTPWCKTADCENKVRERSGIETKENLL